MTARPLPAAPAARPAPWRVHLQLLLMALLWGATWSWGRTLASSMPALTAAAWRCVAASAVLLLWMRHTGRLRALLALSRRQWAWLAAAAALGVFGYAACFMSGLRLIAASRAAVITTLTPALTLLCAALFFGERLNARIALGMALAAGGAAFAISHGRLLHLLDGGLGQGEWLILGCVALWTGYTLLGRAALTGNLAEARALNAKLVPLYQEMFCEPSPAAPKWALEKLGLCGRAVRLPMVSLSEVGQARVNAALQKLQLI